MQQSVIISLIEKFINREITTEEFENLRERVEKDEVKEEYLSSFYQEAWNKAEMDRTEIDPTLEKQMWENLKKYLYLTEEKRPIETWKRIAAIFIVAVLSSAMTYFIISSRFNQQGNLEVNVGIGEKAQVKLPDGSLIWLNSVSRLSYSPDYGRSERKVILSGEGYFEVKSSLSQPFIVETPDKMHVKAFGTKFNVKSYSEDTQTESFLLEGKIEVTTNNLSQILAPNEKIIFDKVKGTTTKTKLKTGSDAITWMQDRLTFDSQTLEDIANILQRRYQINVIFQSEHLKQMKYTGKVKSNKIEDVLMLISNVSPVTCTLQDSVIIFSE